jgi:hypothetical protein
MCTQLKGTDVSLRGRRTELGACGGHGCREPWVDAGSGGVVGPEQLRRSAGTVRGALVCKIRRRRMTRCPSKERHMNTTVLLVTCVMVGCAGHEQSRGTEAPLQSAAGTSADAGATADADGPTCGERSAAAAEAVLAAIDAADPTCSVKSDCSNIWVSTDCWLSCGVILSRAQVTAAGASIAEQNQGVCEGFAADGCELVPPPCPGGGHDDFDCIAGRCVWPAPATPDAGARND